jgi:hypothetical protein
MTKRDLPHWHLPSMLFHCIIDYTTNHIETLPIGINSHGIVDSGHALTSTPATCCDEYDLHVERWIGSSKRVTTLSRRDWNTRTRPYQVLLLRFFVSWLDGLVSPSINSPIFGAAKNPAVRLLPVSLEVFQLADFMFTSICLSETYLY